MSNTNIQKMQFILDLETPKNFSLKDGKLSVKFNLHPTAVDSSD